MASWNEGCSGEDFLCNKILNCTVVIKSNKRIMGSGTMNIGQVNIIWDYYKRSEVKWSHSVVSDSLRPHGLQPTMLLCPQDFPGNSAGVDCHFLLQGIFPTQGSNPGLPYCRQTLNRLSHQGSPTIKEHRRNKSSRTTSSLNLHDLLFYLHTQKCTPYIIKIQHISESED